jgi:hypothetical protein
MVWPLALAPAVAVNLAVVALAAAVTDAGTVRAELLDETATFKAADAAADKVTVHVEVPPGATADGAHCNAVTVTFAGAIAMDAVPVLPFKDAVTVAV